MVDSLFGAKKTQASIGYGVILNELNQLPFFKGKVTDASPVVGGLNNDVYKVTAVLRNSKNGNEITRKAFSNKDFFAIVDQISIFIKENVGIYAWHGSHHYAHIENLIKREGWV